MCFMVRPQKKTDEVLHIASHPTWQGATAFATLGKSNDNTLYPPLAPNQSLALAVGTIFARSGGGQLELPYNFSLIAITSECCTNNQTPTLCWVCGGGWLREIRRKCCQSLPELHELGFNELLALLLLLPFVIYFVAILQYFHELFATFVVQFNCGQVVQNY